MALSTTSRASKSLLLLGALVVLILAFSASGARAAGSAHLSVRTMSTNLEAFRIPISWDDYQTAQYPASFRARFLATTLPLPPLPKGGWYLLEVRLMCDGVLSTYNYRREIFSLAPSTTATTFYFPTRTYFIVKNCGSKVAGLYFRFSLYHEVLGGTPLLHGTYRVYRA